MFLEFGFDFCLHPLLQALFHDIWGEVVGEGGELRDFFQKIVGKLVLISVCFLNSFSVDAFVGPMGVL